MNAAEARGAGKRYGGRWVLRNIDFSLPSGAVYGLVGPNGAGKSTLLYLLVGLARADEGEVTTFGARPGSAEVLPDVAFVAQDAPLPRRMRVGELNEVCAAMNPRWDRSVVDERVEQLQLNRRSRVGSLSGGQRAQLALALALAKQPRLLVLDEPVASLDPLARRTFLGALMGAVAERDLTVLYSTHLLEDLERACDHLAVLAAGELRLAAPTEEVLSGHLVVAGPADRAVPSGVTLLTSVMAGRQAEYLVALDPAVPQPAVTLDPAWTARTATLEEVVFAYLGERRPSAQLELVS